MTRLGLYCLGLLALLAQSAGLANSAHAEDGVTVRIVGAASPGILFEGPAGVPTGLAADIVERSFDAFASRQQGVRPFEVLPPDVDRVAGYFRFTEGEAMLPLIERFNAALDNLVLDGIVADLNQEYGLRF